MGRGTSKAGGNSGNKANAMSHADAEEMKKKYESDFDFTTKKSVDKYISNTNFDGQGHSLSQTMNHIIHNGIDLQNTTVDEVNEKTGLNLSQKQFKALQKTDANIDKAMHPLGKAVTLERGAHQGELQRNFGIKDYTKMSEAQLKEALVGAKFKNSAVMSTSYNISGNPFLGNGPASGGREIVYKIKAGPKTKAVFGASSQNEVILGKNTKWKVTNVRFTGKTALPKSTLKEMPQLEIEIETY